MGILNSLISDARVALSARGDELRIDNLILGKTLYTMKGCDSVFTDMNFCLVLLENAYGFAYFQEDIDYSLSKFVNKGALDVIEQTPIYMQVAITDALYCLINKQKFAEPSRFLGNIRQKAESRARLLLEHIPNKSKILLLGAASEIIEEAKRKKCELKVLDLETQKFGIEVCSVHVDDGQNSDLRREIEYADYIVATGMIFVSRTAEKIFEISAEKNKSMTLYMETGSNFGPQLLDYGADVILSEFFPYYDFFGDSKYLLFKKEKGWVSESNCSGQSKKRGQESNLSI